MHQPEIGNLPPGAMAFMIPHFVKNPGGFYYVWK